MLIVFISTRAYFIIVRLSRLLRHESAGRAYQRKDCLPVGPALAKKWID